MGQDGRRRDYLFRSRSGRPRLIPMHFIRSMLAALAALAAPVLLSASASAFENRVDARLLVETDRLDPGKSTRIALKLSPQQGWHVYWSNPGDSGMPPRITWSLPPKVKISDLRHPAPVAKDAAGFVSYVHPGDEIGRASCGERGCQNV